MTTVGDAIKSAIDTNWSVVSGGTKPTLYSTEDIQQQPVIVADYILIKQESYRWDKKRLNDSFVRREHWIDIEIGTRGDAGLEERLDTLATEVERILTPTNVTGYHEVDTIKGSRERDIKLKKYVEKMTVYLMIKSTASAITPGTATGNDIDAMTMYGAANAAWVPCNLYGGSNYNQIWTSIASNGSNGEWGFLVPLPTVKGTLKLYIAGTRITIQDADVANYVTQTVLYGILFNATTGLDTDNTDKATAAQHTDTFTGVDCSSYDNVKVWLNVVSNAANALDVYGVAVKCYYA